ncbi:MAG: DUF2442 domain-containing protein [Acetobacteraceae bacterium]|jgi:hypothetical protein
MKTPAPTTTNTELQHALAAGRRRRASQRRAATVRYDPTRDSIEIDLTDGVGVRLPRTMLPEFRDVPPSEMPSIRISPAGYGIRLDAHDIAVSVHGLIAALATPGDMAASLGKLGGSAKTKKKRDSARRNGVKGGRPRRTPQAA